LQTQNRFDTSNKQIENVAADLMSLNRDLIKYGPEAKSTISLLREYIAARIVETWPQEIRHKPGLPDPPAWQLLENVQQKLLSLAPMDHPFEETIVVSAQPMQEALGRISAP
jgi:type VI protein secretion system component VasA